MSRDYLECPVKDCGTRFPNAASRKAHLDSMPDDAHVVWRALKSTAAMRERRRRVAR